MARRKTHEEFVQDIAALTGDEYTVTGKYLGSSVKVQLRHNVCGYEWLMLSGNFLRGKRCPKCAKLKTTDQFRSEVSELTKENLEVTGTYINCTTPIELKCTRHNNTFKSTPSSVLRGRMVCKECNAEYLSKVQRKPTETFLKELAENHKGALQCTGEYINTHTKIGFHCLVCNYVFFSEPNSVLRISGCPSCAASKGEKTVKEYLVRHHIEFTPRKAFDGCRSVRPLPFDFYVPSYNLLVEYDGKQHFEPIDYFGGEEKFKSQVERDTIKNNFAKNNQINLLRIPYTVVDDQINKVLDSYFRKGKPEDNLKQGSKAENLTPNGKVMI